VHFPEHYAAEQSVPRAVLSSIVFAAFFTLCRLRGRKIIWFVHDVFSFEGRNRHLTAAFMTVFSRLVWAYVFLSASSEAMFKRANPYCNAAVSRRTWFFHSPYAVTRLSAAEIAALRRQYFGDAANFVVGFVGYIKKYKNVASLKRIDLTGGPGLKLLVAGHGDAESRDEAQAVAAHFAGSGNFIYLDRRLDNDEFERVLQACDVAILPYLTSYNSGIAMYCLSCGIRVLASDLPIFRELRDRFGSTWVRIMSDDVNADIRAMIAEPIDERQRADLDRELAGLDVEKSAARFVAFLTESGVHSSSQRRSP
jgi:glycosyltransferase involved in cell wall biosynthesis